MYAKPIKLKGTGVLQPGWVCCSMGCAAAATDCGVVWRLYLVSVQGLFQLIFPLLISARKNISGCRCPRQSHQRGRHDYQSRSVLQMGEGEELTAPSSALSRADVALSSPWRLHITSCQKGKKYRTSCDSPTSTFITLLQKNKSPHCANNLCSRLSLF